MDKKIVATATTIFMLGLCVVAAITLSIILNKKNSDLIEVRTGSLTLSSDTEIGAEDGVVIRGSALISALTGISDIESRIPIVKEPIYGYIGQNGTKQSIYRFRYGSVYTDKAELIKKINPTMMYVITYITDTDTNGNNKPISKSNDILIDITQL